jgi:hypothetical protein
MDLALPPSTPRVLDRSFISRRTHVAIASMARPIGPTHHLVGAGVVLVAILTLKVPSGAGAAGGSQRAEPDGSGVPYILSGFPNSSRASLPWERLS